MNFSKKVELLIENKNPKLSSFIFEEKEDNKEDEEESAEGLFDMKDEEEESGDKDSNKDNKDEDSEDDALESDDVDPTESDSSDVSKQQIETLTTQIEAIKNTIDKVNKDDGTQSIESFIAGAIAKDIVDNDVNESNYSKNSISSFVLTEDSDLEDVERNIDVLDRVLTKGTDLVDKFKKGKEINISSYVTAAINAYKNFDNLFAKEKIVKQATINVLILNSGAKADANIKQFEELFHEELHRQFGIEYPEYALVTKSHNTAVGAMKQG